MKNQIMKRIHMEAKVFTVFFFIIIIYYFYLFIFFSGFYFSYSDQVALSSSFASDWLRIWREYSRPITERSNTKSNAITDHFSTLN